VSNEKKGPLRIKAGRIARRRALRGKKAVLFGASLVAAQVKKELEENGVTVDAVIDNDPDKVGRRYQGLVVQRPEDVLVPFNEDYVVILVAFSPAREMLHQVETLGYRKGRNAFVITPVPLDESLFSFWRFSLRAVRGYRKYRKLTRGRADSTLFVMPYPGTGDIYLVELFLQSFVERQGIGDYVLAVGSKRCAQVARMMGERHIKVTDEKSLHQVIAYSRFMRSTGDSVVVLNEGWAPEPTEWLRGYNGLNFEEMFRHIVFEFEDQVAPQVPVSSADNPAVLDIFAEQGLIPGRTVVLSPYTNTLFDIPDEAFWERVAARCAERGFTVCTNCGPKEEPIAGTKAASFPLSLAGDFVETAGYFVGVRSGFCDIVSGTGSRQVVLYDKDGRFYKGSAYEYFSLVAMGLGRDVCELEFCDGGGEDIVDEVVEALIVNELSEALA
jgi:hypothetical protein